MKKGAIIGRMIGLIGLIGLMRLIGPIGLMGPIGLSALIALMALMGCSSESEGLLQQEQRAVGFGTYTEQFQTRGEQAESQVTRSEVRGAIPDGGSMGIYAYYHDGCRWATDATPKPNFMWNQKATYDADQNVFNYSPLKYWPNEEDDKVSFIAYYPYTDAENLESPDSPANTGLTPNLTNSGTGLPTFNFEVKNTVEDQVDLLVSDLITDLPQSRDTEGDPGTPFNDLSIYDKVKFVFHHALAKVEIRIVADAEIRKDIELFKIHDNGLKLTNLYYNGTLTTAYDAGNTTMTWDDRSLQRDFQFKTYVPQLLMPQVLADGAMLDLDYEITFKSDGTSYHYVDGVPVAKEHYTYSNTASLKLKDMKQTGSGEALTAWLPNHHYVYTIRLRANRIDFTGEVVAWGDTDAINDIAIEE